MLNIKKAITVSGILLNNFVSLSSIIMFCCLGNLYAQMQSVPDFPEGRKFDPRHPHVTGEPPALRDISENVSEANRTITPISALDALSQSLM